MPARNHLGRDDPTSGGLTGDNDLLENGRRRIQYARATYAAAAAAAASSACAPHKRIRPPGLAPSAQTERQQQQQHIRAKLISIPALAPAPAALSSPLNHWRPLTCGQSQRKRRKIQYAKPGAPRLSRPKDNRGEGQSGGICNVNVSAFGSLAGLGSLGQTCGASPRVV